MNKIDFFKKISSYTIYAGIFTSIITIAYSKHFNQANELALASVISLYTILLISKYDFLNKKLESIDDSLKKSKPDEYKDFDELSGPLRKLLVETLKSKKKAKVQILAFAAKFSGPFIYDKIRSIIKEANCSCKIEIEIALVKADTLKSHNLEYWINHLENTKKNLVIFKEKTKNEPISISIYEYDNLPHWHGILVNSYTLFMGRTEWENFDKPNTRPELHVGEIEYRRFTKDDRNGGAERIKRFEDWLNYYKYRSVYLDDLEREGSQFDVENYRI